MFLVSFVVLMNRILEGLVCEPQGDVSCIVSCVSRNGMRFSSSLTEATVLNGKKVECSVQVGDEFLPQIKEFKYLIFLLKDGSMDLVHVCINKDVAPVCITKKTTTIFHDVMWPSFV